MNFNANAIYYWSLLSHYLSVEYKIMQTSFFCIPMTCNILFCDCRYIAAIDGVVNKRHLIAIGEGTVIEGIRCTPDSVELLPQQPDIPRPRLRIVVLVIYSSLLELSDIQYSCCFLCVALCQPGSAAFLLVANFHLLIWNPAGS
jgi:hypothetical protein